MELDNKFYLSFGIGGLLMVLLFGGLKYLNNVDMTFMSTFIIFIYGGFVAQMFLKKGRSFIKDITVTSVLIIFLWLLFNPVYSAGSNLIIRKIELIGIITVLIVLLEREVMNAIARKFHRKERIHPGFIGNFVIFLFIIWSGLFDAFANIFQKYWWGLLIWMTFFLVSIYFISIKMMKGTSNKFFSFLDNVQKRKRK